MAATKRQRFVSPEGLLKCSDCKRMLAPDRFLTITVRDKRCKPGHTWTGSSVDCRECRNEKKRLGRQRRAEEAGRRFVQRGDRAEYEAQRQAAREKRRAAWAICLAFWALVKMTPEERHRRMIASKVKRQRVRYNTDPAYQAVIKARKIRRKRAQKGTQVVPINRELVAKRDGWRCGICGESVTRNTWSIDHVIPLSMGGSHTYGNVVLAHRSCNSARGAGRLPVQAPLFPMLPVPSRPCSSASDVPPPRVTGPSGPDPAPRVAEPRDFATAGAQDV